MIIFFLKEVFYCLPRGITEIQQPVQYDTVSYYVSVLFFLCVIYDQLNRYSDFMLLQKPHKRRIPAFKILNDH